MPWSNWVRFNKLPDFLFLVCELIIRRKQKADMILLCYIRGGWVI